MSDLTDIIAGAATRYGQDPATLTRIGQIESGLNPAAHNASGADGLFQFMPKTAASYGLTNTQDPVASADAAARLLRDNRTYLTKTLGRDPTGGELYVAHQEGASGAAKLLANPDAPAASLIGTQAVLQNGGNQGMTARDFANMWTSRYDGAKAPAGRSLGALYAGNVNASQGGTPQSGMGGPALSPGLAMAATAPVGADGLTQAPAELAPTVSNGGAGGLSAAARSKALITGQGGLSALFT